MLWLIILLAQENISTWERVLERWGLAIVILFAAILALIYLYKNSVRKEVYQEAMQNIAQMKKDVDRLIDISQSIAVNQEHGAEIQSITAQALTGLAKQVQEIDVTLQTHHELFKDRKNHE